MVGRVFRIRDELVFHAGCVNLPAVLEVELRDTKEALRVEKDLRRDAVNMRNEIRAGADRHEVLNRLALDAMRAELAESRREAQRLREQIAALEGELEPVITPPPPAPAPAPERADPVREEVEVHDASSIRFGLLEPYEA